MFTLYFCLLSNDACIILDSMKFRKYLNISYFLKSYLNDAMSKFYEVKCICLLMYLVPFEKNHVKSFEHVEAIKYMHHEKCCILFYC